MQRFANFHVSFAVMTAAWACLAQPALAQEAGAQEQAPPDPAATPPAAPATTPPDPAVPSVPSAPPPVAPPAALPSASTSITGTVVSETSGAPLAGATVILADTGKSAIADVSGQFTIADVAPGTYTLEVSMIGYLSAETSVTVSAGAPVQALTVQLPDDPKFSEVIVIVGSRTERTATQTPVAVDVFTAEQIRETGYGETPQILAALAPSFKAVNQTIADGSDHVIPASLRGLGPDQVLVLINGKRRHSSALVHVNGTFGRGTVGVDLGKIPPAAIERIEVLRDGAAAQYGSDAIAGVINIVLKDYVDVLDVSARTGITASGDGFELLTDANYGFRIGDQGYFNLSGSFLQRNPTDRSGDWAGGFYSDLNDDPTADNFSQEDYEEATRRLAEAGLTRKDVSLRIGQSRATMGALMFNAQIPVAKLELYSFGSAAYHNGEAAGFYRRPEQEQQVDLAYYPNGFLPEIHTDIIDWSVALGARTEISDWKVDLSATHGGNAFMFGVENTVNASLGVAAGGTSFDAGGPMFMQNTANLDVVKSLDLKPINKLALVLGSEFRVENYRITAGEPDSYVLGNETTADGRPKAAGAQVFPGFQPANEVDEYRTSIGAYLGAESELTERVLLDLGGRFENYNDFGNTVIGKLATRINLLDNVAVRGAVNTGFRAPSLHQVWFSTISTQFVQNTMTGVLEPRQVLTANNSDPVTEAFGIPDLGEETSLNLSAGFTATPLPNLSLTTDFYRIAIDDRIVLSSQFSDAIPGVADILAEFPDVSRAQFFLNAVDTETMGVDVVVDYSTKIGKGNLGVTGSANFTKTEVTDVNVPQSVADRFGGGDLTAVSDVIFNRQEKNRLEDALPRQKGSLALRYGTGPLSALLRGTYYGPVEFKATSAENDESFDARVIFDLDLGYRLPGGFRVSVGALNLLNTYPEEQEKEINRFYNQFIYSRAISQVNLNGGFYYLRLQYLM